MNQPDVIYSGEHTLRENITESIGALQNALDIELLQRVLGNIENLKQGHYMSVFQDERFFVDMSTFLRGKMKDTELAQKIQEIGTKAICLYITDFFHIPVKSNLTIEAVEGGIYIPGKYLESGEPKFFGKVDYALRLEILAKVDAALTA